MQQIILDLEFTGLDNTFIRDNEIIQVKAFNYSTKKVICLNFGSNKEIGAHPFLSHKVERYFEEDLFSDRYFIDLINSTSNGNREFQFYGWGVDLDKKMLAKYGISIPIIDIREQLQLTEFETKLATEGRSLEVAYYLATRKIPTLENHDGIEELNLIIELFEIAESLPKNKFLTIMPNGHCSGMPLHEYVSNYRRAADGYRFNNNDLLAKSLNHMIDQINPFDDENNDDY